ncbi:sulfite exporter TauE/SafE family protein [Hydrogenimonas urashimensis]|uniref:sulfite exporter TauE/SafE family protein n=1 Tax=Hydrogenimonas urashimensis TaxID=2740515 RepID=UPI0019150797|nr:sulfite exporter TauE/SafE family protein [Hydrogenimonas urashimensis]
MGSVELSTIFLVALLGSFGHCIGMCGGFVLAYTAAKVDAQWSKTRQMTAHLLYSLGRVTSYMIIGAFFGYLGQKVSFDMTAKGLLFIAVGMLMLLIGLSLIGKLKFLNSIESSIAQSSWFGRLFKMVIHSRTLPSFFLMGMLNGFIPCGLVYFFATAAIVAGSALKGAIVMGVFGIATIPAMLGVGIFSSLIKGSSYRQLVIKIAAVVVMLFGLFTSYKGYIMITKPEIIQKKMQKMHEELKILPERNVSTHSK